MRCVEWSFYPEVLANPLVNRDVSFARRALKVTQMRLVGDVIVEILSRAHNEAHARAYVIAVTTKTDGVTFPHPSYVQRFL